MKPISSKPIIRFFGVRCVFVLICALGLSFSPLSLEAGQKKSGKSKKTTTSLTSKKKSGKAGKSGKAVKSGKKSKPPSGGGSSGGGSSSGGASGATSSGAAVAPTSPTPASTPTLPQSESQQWIVTTFVGPGEFDWISGIAVDDSGNVFVSDAGNQRINKITPEGLVSFYSGKYGDIISGGDLKNPSGVAVDKNGNVYVADTGNQRIRKIPISRVPTTLAGPDYIYSSDNSNTLGGYADGSGAIAKFRNPNGVAVDGSGNVYVADSGNQRIRKITPEGSVSTLAGSGVYGFADGDGLNSKFSSPAGVVVDKNGNVYVADAGNHKIRKITSAGVVTTLAGSGIKGYGDGTGAGASFNSPVGVAVDSSGNVYVAELGNQRVRKITPEGLVTTIAGSGTQGYADGLGNLASFSDPRGVAVDGNGNVYVADYKNKCIRKIVFSK